MTDEEKNLNIVVTLLTLSFKKNAIDLHEYIKGLQAVSDLAGSVLFLMTDGTVVLDSRTNQQRKEISERLDK